MVDADSHVTEPPDLFTSRVARKWADVVPRVEIHPRIHHSHWRIGGSWVQAVGCSPWPGGVTTRRSVQALHQNAEHIYNLD